MLGVIPTEKRRTSDHSGSGLLRLLGVHRGGVLLRLAVASRAVGPTRTFRSRSWLQNGEEPNLLWSSASFGHVGVRHRGNGLSWTAARRRAKVMDAWASGRSTNWAARTSSLVSTVGAGVIGSESTIGRCRAALRVHSAPLPSRTFRLARAHSSGGITSGCTRRHRANVAHMQVAVNRGRRDHAGATGFLNIEDAAAMGVSRGGLLVARLTAT